MIGKKLTIALLGYGAGIIYASVRLFRGDMGSLPWPFVFVYLLCRGVYESVTEKGFCMGKAREEMIRQAYRKLFGRVGPAVMWSLPAAWILVIILALLRVSVWIVIGGLAAVIIYQIWLTIIVRKELKK